MEKKEGCLYSWPAIILSLLIFWPLGVALIIKKVFSNRKALLASSGMLSVLGVLMYCLTGIWAICAMAFTDFSDSENVSAFVVFLVMTIVFWVGGFALRRSSKKIKKEANEIKEYLSIIVNRNIRQLDEMVYITGKPYEVIRGDIQKMIDRGYLKSAYIDDSLKEVILPNSTPVPQSGAHVVTANAASARSKIVACPCCGANNAIYGDIGECEYCGSPLKGVCDFQNADHYTEQKVTEVNSSSTERNIPETYYIGSVKVEKNCILEIDALMSKNQSISAIRYVRELSGLSLPEAKIWVKNYEKYNLKEPQFRITKY